jgi:ATP-dependent Clp protease ATP-binding subunit ClpC
VVIELSDSARELLVDKGYDPTMGARPLRRAIQRYIEDPLADFVLGSDLKPGVTIIIDRKDESDEEVSITLAGGRKREKVAVPAASDDDAPEDEPVDEPAE